MVDLSLKKHMSDIYILNSSVDLYFRSWVSSIGMLVLNILKCGQMERESYGGEHILSSLVMYLGCDWHTCFRFLRNVRLFKLCHFWRSFFFLFLPSLCVAHNWYCWFELWGMSFADTEFSSVVMGYLFSRKV